METKICTKCKQEKLLEEFYFKNKEKNIKNSRCKICCEQSRNSKKHYQEYKDNYILRNKVRRENLIKTNVPKLLDYYKTHNCVDCGESDPIVLEFDHLIQKDKKYGISNMLGNYHWDKILSEIEKCEVVCANCHKRRTAKQFDWYKLKLLNE